MQNLNNVLELAQNRIRQTKPSGDTSNNTLTMTTMAKAWRLLQSWKLVHSNVDSTEFKSWQVGLRDLTDDQVMNGVKQARDFSGFFSLPAFRELCQQTPAIDGLPAVDTAYEEACLAPSPKARAKWSHPIVYRAGVLTGWSDLHALPRDMALPRFKRNYEILCRRVAAGEDINLEIPEAIPERVSRVLPPEEAEVQMKSLREQVGI